LQETQDFASPAINLLFLDMETVIAKPANKAQLAALKAVLKALKVEFTTQESPYNPEFIAKVERAEEQIKSGHYRKVTPSDIWK
jgi:hypothetical protein